MDGVSGPDDNVPGLAFLKEAIGYHFRERLKYPLAPGCVNHDLVCYLRESGPNEARFFIRLCRAEQGRKDRPRLFNDRPYWRYGIWY